MNSDTWPIYKPFWLLSQGNDHQALHWEDKYTYAKGKSKEWEYTLQTVILSLHSDQKNLLHNGFSP